MTLILLAVSAVAPSLLLVWFFHARDTFREPPRVLWTTFVLGIVIVAPVLLVAWPMTLLAEASPNAVVHGFITAFFGAAIPEEIFKWLVLWGYAMRHAEFDEPMDGIVYGATASLGFATFENILYVTDGGAAAAFMRAITAVPGHAFLGVIMGYYLGRARFADGQRRRSLMVSSLVVPILLHGAYDFPLLAATKLEQPDAPAAVPVLLLLLLVPIVLGVESIWAMRLVQQSRLAQLATLPRLPLPAASVATASVATAAVEKARPRGTLAGWLATLSGGLVASIGVLMIFAVAVGVMVEGIDSEEVGVLVLGTAILGLLPAVAGSGAFIWGVRRLNRA